MKLKASFEGRRSARRRVWEAKTPAAGNFFFNCFLDYILKKLRLVSLLITVELKNVVMYI